MTAHKEAQKAGYFPGESLPVYLHCMQKCVGYLVQSFPYVHVLLY